MCLAVLQSERQVQLVTKVLNDEIDLIVSHDRLLLLLGLSGHQPAIAEQVWFTP